MRSGTDMLMIPSDFTDILLTHKMKELEAVKQSNKVLFIDTDCLITRFYIDFWMTRKMIKRGIRPWLTQFQL